MRPVQNVLKFLRDRNRLVKQNNLKINEWVDSYLAECFLNGRPVNILTQWCLSRSLKKRFQDQGGTFTPTKKELRVLGEEIPDIISSFLSNGLRANWLVTFNRALIDPEVLPPDAERCYKEMITSLAKDPLYQGNTLFLDWEDDVLGGRPVPSGEVLEKYSDYVSQSAFQVRLQQLAIWAEQEAGLDKTPDDLKEDIILEAALEAQEALTLLGEDALFGKEDFVIFPLETAERYDNFNILVKDFKKRVVSVMTPYPWRVAM